MEVLTIHEEPEGTRGNIRASVLLVDEQFNEHWQQAGSRTQRHVPPPRRGQMQRFNREAGANLARGSEEFPHQRKESALVSSHDEGTALE